MGPSTCFNHNDRESKLKENPSLKRKYKCVVFSNAAVEARGNITRVIGFLLATPMDTLFSVTDSEQLATKTPWGTIRNITGEVTENVYNLLHLIICWDVVLFRFNSFNL